MQRLQKGFSSYIVTRATGALPQTGTTGLFQVTGTVDLISIIGVVTTAIGAVANATKLTHNPDGTGATTDLCATVEANAAAVGSRFSITGILADALIKTVDLPIAKTQSGAFNVVSGVDANGTITLPPGVLGVSCAGNDGGGGRVRWSVVYQPLEAGANVVAL